MKEVCIINYGSNAAVYGIGTYIKEYTHCLENIGCKVNLIELGTSKNQDDFYITKDGNIRKIHIPYLQKSDFDKYNKGVCRLLRMYIQDSVHLIFHFHYSSSDSLLDSIKEYFPLSKSVFTIHYLSWSERLQGNYLLYEKIIRKQTNKNIEKKYRYIIDGYKKEKTLLGKVDHIVCLSDDTYNLIYNLYGIKSNVWLIPNGLRKKSRNLSEKQKRNFRTKYYINPEEKILLFVGRINPIKGIYPLLSCFNEVVKEYPNCRLVVIGDGNINEAIKNSGEAGTKILFTGRLDQKTLYRWYQMADIALFPSFYEECSYVGIEMMMHGLPVVASDGYSVKNMFFDNKNAKTAEIEDFLKHKKFEKNLKTTILEALNSGLSALQKGSKKLYDEKYSIKRMQEKYIELLNNL
jgi:glycosyltransferase